MAEVITSSSAQTRPIETASNSTMRDRAISAQEARIISDTLCLSSSVSVARSPSERASRKK